MSIVSQIVVAQDGTVLSDPAICFPVGKRAEDWVSGDGGPAIVLQESAARLWQGAADFENSLMNGGAVETDYDIACDAGDGVITRHGREMIVLDAVGGLTLTMTLASGAIVVAQFSAEREEIIGQAEALLAVPNPPYMFPFHIQDAALRLLPAADDGNGTIFGYVEVPVRPGVWTCHLSHEPGPLLLLVPPP